ncbi:MAG: TIGR02391 family protein [Bacteroidota bacterium]
MNENFAAIQNRDNCSNSILRFIEIAMNPVRYNSHDVFASMQTQVNAALLFEGFEVRDNGKIGKVKKVTTLKEAEQRANELKEILAARNIHADVLRFCRAELLQENYFHAVLEAAKSVADKIRERTGLSGDGAEIVDEAFGIKHPILKLNSLSNDTEEAEQKGFSNLLKGLFGTFRNPTAHAAKIQWSIEKDDALDLLSLVSYAHRRIDKAKKTES